MLKEPTCSERGCKHFLGLKRHDGPETEDKVDLRSLPRRHPRRDRLRDNPHTSPFPGDHGIRFEPEEEKAHA